MPLINGDYCIPVELDDASPSLRKHVQQTEDRLDLKETAADRARARDKVDGLGSTRRDMLRARPREVGNSEGTRPRKWTSRIYDQKVNGRRGLRAHVVEMGGDVGAFDGLLETWEDAVDAAFEARQETTPELEKAERALRSFLASPREGEVTREEIAQLEAFARAHRPRPRVRGRARVQPKPGQMNKLESDYAREVLAPLLAAGKIARYDFEPEKLRLADRTFYSPDFRVILPDGTVEFHETKGHWEDDARVKIKVAAEMHPYTFIAVQRRAKSAGGGWTTERF